MKDRFSDGMWPVMVTPFLKDKAVDYQALEKVIDWYIREGSNGLFATCQSSEIFFLSLKERLELTAFVKEKAAGRVPVIASGHVSYSLEDQITELKGAAQAGADAVILISNRLAGEGESDDVFLENLKKIMDQLPESLPLGFYECPYPYKRVLSEKVTRFCAESGRFYFLKDTSCDMDNIRMKLDIMKGSNMKLYNANTATLLESLKAGAAGYSGVMANFHPGLYRWLLDNWKKEPEKAELLQGVLTMCSFIELKNYPLSAKFYMQGEGLPIQGITRKNTADHISETELLELRQLREISVKLKEMLQGAKTV